MTRNCQLQLPSELAAKVMTRNCQLVTIRACSKGHDSELPASYHWGMALTGQAEKRLKGSGENVATAWGSEALVCLLACGALIIIMI